MSGDLDLVRSMLGAADYFAIVSTTRPDGSVHASLVKAGVLDDPVGGEPAVGLVVVQGSSRKLGHLRRTGQATIVIQHAYRWVAVDGPARLYGPDDPVESLSPDDVRRLLRDVFIAAGGTHDDWDEYDRAMASQRAAVVMVEPRRISGRG